MKSNHRPPTLKYIFGEGKYAEYMDDRGKRKHQLSIIALERLLGFKTNGYYPVGVVSRAFMILTEGMKLETILPSEATIANDGLSIQYPDSYFDYSTDALIKNKSTKRDTLDFLYMQVARLLVNDAAPTGGMRARPCTIPEYQEFNTTSSFETDMAVERTILRLALLSGRVIDSPYLFNCLYMFDHNGPKATSNRVASPACLVYSKYTNTDLSVSPHIHLHNPTRYSFGACSLLMALHTGSIIGDILLNIAYKAFTARLVPSNEKTIVRASYQDGEFVNLENRVNPAMLGTFVNKEADLTYGENILYQNTGYSLMANGMKYTIYRDPNSFLR